jgi:hypothetical protein
MPVAQHPDGVPHESADSRATDPLHVMQTAWRTIETAWREHKTTPQHEREKQREVIDDAWEQLRYHGLQTAPLLTAKTGILETGLRARRKTLDSLTSTLNRLTRQGDQPERLADTDAYHRLLTEQAGAIEDELTRRATAVPTQQMVPSARDLRVLSLLRQPTDGAVQQLHKEREEASEALRHARRGEMADRLSQRIENIDEDIDILTSLASLTDWNGLEEAPATALILAERRGRHFAERERTAAVQRMLKSEWTWLKKYPYSSTQAFVSLLGRAHDYLMETYEVVTNINLSRPMGPERTLLDEMLSADEHRFLNFWETGTSSGHTDAAYRGSREELFGYASTLRRDRSSGGNFQSVLPDANRDRFNPDQEDRRRLPKYAGFNSPLRPLGVDNYGETAIHWRPGVRGRITLTPADSFEAKAAGAGGYTSLRNLYPLMAHGEEDVIRLLLAEVTGFTYDTQMDTAREKGEIARGRLVRGYFEAQIHGDLYWRDVSRIVIDSQSPNARKHEQRLSRFASDHGYSFTVTVL